MNFRLPSEHVAAAIPSESDERLSERLIWYDSQLCRGDTVVFGSQTGDPESKTCDSDRQGGGPGLLTAGNLQPREVSASGEIVLTKLDLTGTQEKDSWKHDAETEQRLFGCLRGLRALFGTLGRVGDGPAEGVPQQGELWNDRYEVMERLGSGSYGHVMLAFDRHMGRDVALKFPRVETWQQVDRREDLLRDAQVAARFDHQGILTVHELIIPRKGSPSLVMPFCRGGSLREWLRAHPDPLGVDLSVRLVLELAAATQYAHERNVVHRDLKPENILLQSRRGLATARGKGAETPPERLLEEWQPRIADFGLALVREPAEPRKGIPNPMGGTLRYMAPEQMRGEETALGPATDVYALGMLLVELLLGQTAFRSARDEKGATVHNCPHDLRRIIHRCTATELHNRYSTVAEFQIDLERFRSGNPVHAGKIPGPSVQLRKWIWRHKLPIGLAVFGLIGLFGVLMFERLPSPLERTWSRWGQVPSDFPFAGIEHSGNGSVHLDPNTGNLVIVSTRARMAQLGTLPSKGDLDLTLDLDLSKQVEDCGFFFGYRQVPPTPKDPGIARAHIVSLTRLLNGVQSQLAVRRNIAYFIGDGRFHYASGGQLRRWKSPPRMSQLAVNRQRVRLRLSITDGVVRDISVDDQTLAELTDPSIDQEIIDYHDLNLSGPFGVFVNDSTTVQFGLPERNQTLTSLP